MVRAMPIVHAAGESFSPALLGLGLFVSVSLLVSLCAKHAKQKYTSKTSDAKAPFPSAKQLITAFSNKAISVNGGKKSSSSEVGKGGEESGVWQKAILMGEKCQPPEFSGVIYYDYAGNRVPEMPKSPRNAPLSPLRSFNFPTNENTIY